MLRKFAGNLVLLLLANLLVKPIWVLGIDRTVQITVGSEAYGLYAALFNFSFLFSIFLDLGIHQFNNAQIAKDPGSIHTLFGQAMGLKAFLSLLFLMLSFSAALLVGYNQFALGLFGFLALNQVLAGYLVFLRTNLNGLHLFKTDTFLSVFDKLLMILVCTWLFYNPIDGVFEIKHFVYAQSVCYLVAVFVGYILVKNHVKNIQWRPSWILFKEILKQAYPYALLSVLMVIYMRMDMVFIERLHPLGSKEAGLYASAYRLLDALTMVAVLVAGLLFPIFSRLIAQGSKPTQLMRLSYQILVSGAILVVVLCLFQSNEIMTLLYPNATTYQIHLFTILMSGFIPACLNYVFGTLLTANHNLRLLNQISIVAILFNIGLNSCFISRYGAQASAWIALATHVLVAAANIGFAIKKLKLKTVDFEFHYLMYWILWVAPSCFIFIAPVDWKLQSILFLIWGLIGLFSSKIIQPSIFKSEFLESSHGSSNQ